MSSHNEQFDIQVPGQVIILDNTAPQLSNKMSKVFVHADQEKIISVGTPFDMQLDDFWMEEWGVESGEIPSWI